MDAAQEHVTDVAVSDAVGDATNDIAADASAGDLADATAGDAADDGLTCTPACATGKACVNGVCMPAPVVLARAPGCGAARIVVAGGRVYWTEHATGFVKSVPTAGGATPTVVAQGQMMPGPITADATAVYWSNAGDRKIMKAPLIAADAGTSDAGATDAGAPAELLTAPAVVNGLLASNHALYFSGGPSAFKAGAPPVPLGTFATCRSSSPAALAADDTFLYQTDLTFQYITRERLDGTQASNDPCAADPQTAPKVLVPDTITHSQGELLFDAIGLSGGEVYWADNASINAKSTDGTTTTSSRQVALSAGGNVITGFVLSGGFVYFGESADFQGGPTANTIQEAPLVPGEAGADDAKVIAEGQPGAASFTADVSHIYWTTRAPSATALAADDCTIVSLSD